MFQVLGSEVEKIGNQWAQIVYKHPLKTGRSFFDIQITKSKKNYVCIGIGTSLCKQQLDSKWEK